MKPLFAPQESDLFTRCPYNLEQLSVKRSKEKDKVHQVSRSVLSSLIFENLLKLVRTCMLILHVT